MMRCDRCGTDVPERGTTADLQPSMKYSTAFRRPLQRTDFLRITSS
jgi:hypothetical protein